MKYFDELKRTMEWLGSKENAIFIGQAVEVPGTAMFNTLKNIDEAKRIELPVFEETQLGMSIGMSLTGKKVISIFPRWNFLLCSTNQIVNHLDKFSVMSDGKVNPNIIIRTAVGSERPLFPGHQHIGNMSSAFRKMVTNVNIIELKEPEDIFPAYEKAFLAEDNRSSILVEFQDFYNEK